MQARVSAEVAHNSRAVHQASDQESASWEVCVAGPAARLRRASHAEAAMVKKEVTGRRFAVVVIPEEMVEVVSGAKIAKPEIIE